MIEITNNNMTDVKINKTMLNYCLTIPLAMHNCFDFEAIRNGGNGDDIYIEFQGIQYKAHVNAKHIEKKNPAYQIALPINLRNSIANAIINNPALNSFNLRTDTITQRIYLA